MPRLEAACCRNLFKAASTGPWKQESASCPSACTGQGAWQHPAPTDTHMAMLPDHSPVHSRAAQWPPASPGSSKPCCTCSLSGHWNGHDAPGSPRSLARGSHSLHTAGHARLVSRTRPPRWRTQPLQTSHDTVTANSTFLQLDLPAVCSPQPAKEAEEVEGMYKPSGRAGQRCSAPAASTAEMGLADSCINDQQPL